MLAHSAVHGSADRHNNKAIGKVNAKIFHILQYPAHHSELNQSHHLQITFPQPQRAMTGKP
jgi:hypothetical protein